MNDTNETQAFELLREIITRGRNGMPYKHLLDNLEKSLEKAPGVRRAVTDSLASARKSFKKD